MRSSFCFSAFNFLHLFWASSWNSDLLTLGVAHGWLLWGFWEEVGAIPDSLKVVSIFVAVGCLDLSDGPASSGLETVLCGLV